MSDNIKAAVPLSGAITQPYGKAAIATITGHSMTDVGSILDAHYLHRDSRLAESALRKLEESVETSN